MLEMHTWAIVRLNASSKAIAELYKGVSDEEARWRPAHDRWSLTEVIHHLYDEEREDFRAALDVILNHPTTSWPEIDPMNWVTTRNYNIQSAGDVLNRFVAERDRSMLWLKGLETADWATQHPGPGAKRPTTAGDTLVAWVAHDTVHLQQIGKLLRDKSDHDFSPYNGSYAGSLE